MKILAFDLGSHFAGAAVLVVDEALRPVGVQAVEEWASEDKDLNTRLWRFWAWAKSLVQKYALASGDIVAVEEPFVGFPKAALVLGQMLGIVRQVAWWAELPLVLISAKEGKMALAGTGSAYKGEMVAAAKMQFEIDCTEHQADALGIALCAAQKLKLANLAKA